MTLEVAVDHALAMEAVDQATDPRKTDATYIFNRLRSEIVSLILGPGTPLDEEELVRSFRVSRSRVRDALVRLAGDGHVVILPNRSIIVAPLDVQGIPRFMDALDLMQRTTHRLAAVSRTEDDLARIRRCDENFNAASEQIDICAMVATNYELHVAIADAGHNAYFTSFYARLLGEARRLLHMHYSMEADQVRANRAANIAEHRALIDAIMASDPDLAERRAHEHSVVFRDHFVRFVDQTFVQDIDVAVLSQAGRPQRRRRKATRRRPDAG
jgi:DNA-binding GntR family transcriptional regulator